MLVVLSCPSEWHWVSPRLLSKTFTSVSASDTTTNRLCHLDKRRIIPQRHPPQANVNRTPTNSKMLTNHESSKRYQAVNVLPRRQLQDQVREPARHIDTIFLLLSLVRDLNFTIQYCDQTVNLTVYDSESVREYPSTMFPVAVTSKSSRGLESKDCPSPECSCPSTTLCQLVGQKLWGSSRRTCKSDGVCDLDRCLF